MSFDWLTSLPYALSEAAKAAAAARQTQLTKPSGALGELESLAILVAARQGVECPSPDPVWIAVFAGDQDVAAEGVSAFPRAVTGEMARSLARGGAAICVAARTGAYLACAKMGIPVLIDGFISTAAALTAERISPGTAAWFIYAHA
jgi:nicotinate-nucleotide--dimethylbenzimidazole phosphoribosyltransferase